MKTKIAIMALAAILVTGLMNSANAHPCGRSFGPRVRIAIAPPPLFRPPVVVYGAPLQGLPTLQILQALQRLL